MNKNLMKSINFSTLYKRLLAGFIVCLTTGLLLRIRHVSALYGSAVIGVAMFLLLITLIIFMLRPFLFNKK